MAVRIVPTRSDPDSAGFWEAAARGELTVLFCRRCDAVLHLPRPYCHACGSWETEYRPVEGRATLFSWTTVARTVHPAFPAPYTVVLVQLDQHPSVRFIGHVPGAPPLEQGMPMTVTFEPVEGTDTVLPNWTPLSTSTATPDDTTDAADVPGPSPEIGV